MCSTNQRSRSIPPSIKLSNVKGSRVTKPRDSSFQGFLNRYGKRRSWSNLPKESGDCEREGQRTEDDARSIGSVGASYEPEALANSSPNPESTEFLSLFLQMAQFLKDLLNAFSIKPNAIPILSLQSTPLSASALREYIKALSLARFQNAPSLHASPASSERRSTLET